MPNAPKPISGIHHVTAICSDPQKNIDFYCHTLGLRLVKLTVNFDDPGSYHLYYGDELGHPGTILTFFAWPGAYRGKVGPPQAAATAFAVPEKSLDFWSDRLNERGIESKPLPDRFGQRVIQFSDPDGLQLELVETAPTSGAQPWRIDSIDPERAIRGFHSVTLVEEGYEKTASLLTNLMQFRHAGADQNRYRYRTGPGEGLASVVDVLCAPGARPGEMGAGVVHHVAFRAAHDAGQADWRSAIAIAGRNVSPVMDRCYFHSIYYREPGGVLFEIATDTPGFTADQSAGELGTKLMLPPWLEKQREQIERAVPRVTLPTDRRSA
jgi:catechol 2,3-dioxygenase-like lactoylglutathione lyase family enzyme